MNLTDHLIEAETIWEAAGYNRATMGDRLERLRKAAGDWLDGWYEAHPDKVPTGFVPLPKLPKKEVIAHAARLVQEHFPEVGLHLQTLLWEHIYWYITRANNPFVIS